MKPLLTVAELLAWCLRAPAGTRLDAQAVAEILAIETSLLVQGPEQITDPTTWRERLWSVSAETRLGVVEVAEALGRPASYVYTHSKTPEPIPHRKLDGVLVFTAGEVRAWLEAREEVIAPGPRDTRPLRVLKR